MLIASLIACRRATCLMGAHQIVDCMLIASLIACRWATCLMGAHQIVDQIYKYRLRTERYDVIAPQGFVDEGLTELTPKQRSSAARLEFVNTVSSTAPLEAPLRASLTRHRGRTPMRASCCMLMAWPAGFTAGCLLSALI